MAGEGHGSRAKRCGLSFLLRVEGFRDGLSGVFISEDERGLAPDEEREIDASRDCSKQRHQGVVVLSEQSRSQLENVTSRQN